jgi:hypothetical protein
MKAREIIPGWPRGRSCSRSYAQDEGGWASWWMMYRVRNPFEREKVEQDIDAEMAYRRKQQRMVDLYRKLYRKGLVETRTTYTMMGWEAYEVPMSRRTGDTHTYLLPRQDLDKGGMKLWIKPETRIRVNLAVEIPSPPVYLTTENEVDRLLFSAFHALRSYEHGNVAPDLAKEIADAIDEYRRRPR